MDQELLNIAVELFWKGVVWKTNKKSFVIVLNLDIHLKLAPTVKFARISYNVSNIVVMWICVY